MSFSLLLGVVLGAVSATRPDSLFDPVGKVVAILGQSMPVFWVGILLILLFTVYLGWLPSAGGLDRLGLKGLILPAVTLGWLFVAAHMRIVLGTLEVGSAVITEASGGAPRRRAAQNGQSGRSGGTGAQLSARTQW